MKHYNSILTLILFLPLFSLGQTDSSNIFEKSKQKLSHPLCSFKRLLNSTSDKFNLSICINPGYTYYAEKEETVHAIFEGTVISVFELDNQYGLTTKFGKYYITYFGLTKPIVEKGNYILTQQSLAKLNINPGADCQLDLFISTPDKNLDPIHWIK